MRLAAVLVLALPAAASAQAPGMYDPTPPLAPPGMTPPEADRDEPPRPAPVDAPEAPERSALDTAIARDAAADRAYGTSTALALPSGRLDLSGRASAFGGIASVAAGIGSGLEISADVAGIGGEQLGFLGGGVKLEIAHGRRWALAATASYHRITEDGGDYMDQAGLWSAGGVVSACSARDCPVLVSAGGGIMGVTESDSDTVPYLSGSLIAGTGSFRPILEGAALLVDNGGLLGFFGARIGGKRVAVDAGFGVLVADGDGGALPMLGLSIAP